MMLLTPWFQLGDAYFGLLSSTTMRETGSRNKHLSGKIKEIQLQFLQEPHRYPQYFTPKIRESDKEEYKRLGKW